MSNQEVDHDLADSPELLSHSSLPQDVTAPEVSMVEESTVTGVSFTPELWMQRRHWALEVLRKEYVRSVLDIGCGPGSLLETLVVPPTTIKEPPILPSQSSSSRLNGSDQLPSPVDTDEEEYSLGVRELFIKRLGGLDVSPSVITSALKTLTPPAQSSTPSSLTIPRWEPLITELWLGGIEKYNAKLEGYEAIVLLEVVEHLDPDVLNRFGVVTFGTYRPKVLLVTTPNFDFNAKFPRAEEHDFAKKGFVDPTGRTDRVFRHSDHKLEMTSKEFREWAEAEAANWGYDVEISGVGVSSHPSYYPSDDPTQPGQPIYASQTAIFRLATGLPLRSPRSVRTVELPFMPGSRESSHPHKLAGKFLHTVAAPGDGRKHPVQEVIQIVRDCYKKWNVGEVSLDELWGDHEVSGRCAGSKRHLVGSLGGFGDCPSISGSLEFMIRLERGRGLIVKWVEFKPRKEIDTSDRWGQSIQQGHLKSAESAEAGGW
ncbi:uncharacterized protein I206_105740 [Kwoniella pini CBS 10737]|uniref:Small RNA 2'-O-methyltransferase n=1 Tax=Kwoniella pini CBS 10737 TaxID=1296096 RepID=A0A1B9I3B2_9TREE|nr:uncharacterized protein I206_03356 [Kwoniella pini CBS 10737]OCF50040.1 hypothetical protein I206_03356 [Kwoniella pini CBS 10737]